MSIGPTNSGLNQLQPSSRTSKDFSASQKSEQFVKVDSKVRPVLLNAQGKDSGSKMHGSAKKALEALSNVTVRDLYNALGGKAELKTDAVLPKYGTVLHHAETKELVTKELASKAKDAVRLDGKNPMFLKHLGDSMKNQVRDFIRAYTKAHGSKPEVNPLAEEVTLSPATTTDSATSDSPSATRGLDSSSTPRDLGVVEELATKTNDKPSDASSFTEPIVHFEIDYAASALRDLAKQQKNQELEAMRARQKEAEIDFAIKQMKPLETPGLLEPVSDKGTIQESTLEAKDVVVDFQEPEKPAPSLAYSNSLTWVPSSGPVGSLFGGLMRSIGIDNGAGQTTTGDLATYHNHSLAAKITFPAPSEKTSSTILEITREDLSNIVGSKQKPTKQMASQLRTLIVDKTKGTTIAGDTGLDTEPYNRMISGATPSYCFDAVFCDPKLTHKGSEVPLNDFDTRFGLALKAGLGYNFNPTTDPVMNDKSPAYRNAQTHTRSAYGMKL